MSDLKSLLSLAGVLSEGFRAQQHYTLHIVDPVTNDVDTPATGDLHTIITNLERTEEYQALADIIKNVKSERVRTSDTGVVSFAADGQIFMFVPM